MKTVRASTDRQSWSKITLMGDNQYMASVQVEPNCMKKPEIEKDHAWIWSVYVDHDLRGKKVGELLMIYAILEAYRLGHTEIGLFVYSTNKPARKLYEKLGFVYHSEVPIMHGDWVQADNEPVWNYGDDGASYKAHREWMDRGYYAEVCPVPWVNDVYEWTMRMRLMLTPEKLRELKKRKKELRKFMIDVEWSNAMDC